MSTLLISQPDYEHCVRCNDKVYMVDKIGPLKGCFFHQQCFKCCVCQTQLTLKTYIHNQLDPDDKNVYCNNHVPKNMAGKMDGYSLGIRAAMNTPKRSLNFNEQIRSPIGERSNYDAQAISIKSALAQQKFLRYANHDSADHGHFDAQALHIAHPLSQTAQISKHVGAFHSIPMDVEIQTEMEMKHRLEEEELFKNFTRKRVDREQRLKQEIEQEWERELVRITRQFEDETNKKKYSSDEMKQLTMRHQREKDDLQQFMTLKRDRAKREMLQHMLEGERKRTKDMVDKHAQEMLTMISRKKAELQAREQEINQLQNMSMSEQQSQNYMKSSIQVNGSYHHTTGYPLLNPPPPAPPNSSKADIYSDPAIFEELDQQAITVAQSDQSTFTELVWQLTHNCVTDVEKARAIFRWITVKNLNTMVFDDSDINADTPMGLLRGIKHGTESYHVLFKRLCSYAGLHCVVIRGYSKSAGYLPGMKFEDKRFRNTWNAVFLDGSWRFVQCNWGARHLVNAKDAPKPGSRGNVDNLRYEYDDHYFLTDPDEFIYEFFPKQKEWQLLRNPVTLKGFEELPFVRSLFFKYGLKFAEEHQRAVMHTDSTGATTLSLVMPPYMVSSLVFHYNLRVMDSDSDEYDGVNMRRYVMQTLVGNSVIFKVHTPATGKYILDVFANLVSAGEYMTGQPMRFKSVCKMQIVCDILERCMVPLPNCASGEWGPLKAYKLFGLIPLTHEEAVVNTNRDLEIRFRMSHPLSNFMTSLHQNGVSDKQLSKCVSKRISEEIVTFKVNFPNDGQFGLDVYTREPGTVPDAERSERHLLTHCCKYLINVKKR